MFVFQFRDEWPDSFKREKMQYRSINTEADQIHGQIIHQERNNKPNHGGVYLEKMGHVMISRIVA